MQNSSAAPSWSQAAIVVLATLAVATALWTAQMVAAPLVLAFVTAIVLGPIHDFLRKMRLGASLSAVLIIFGLLTTVSAVAFMLEPLVWRVVAELPTIKNELRSLLYELRGYLQGLEDLNTELQAAVDPEGAAENAEEGDGAAAQLPSAIDALFLAPIFLGQFLIFLGTLFFSLVCRRDLYDAAARFFSRKGRHTSLRRRMDNAEHNVARYFGTIAIINIGLGVVVSIALTLIGLPLAMIWGAAAAILNFLVYIGPATIAVSLLLAGLVNFDGLMIAAPALTYLLLNATEAQFVTPSLVGRNMELNPLLVFVSIVFWIWLWGPAGGIVAIPILVFVQGLAEGAPERSRARLAA